MTCEAEHILELLELPYRRVLLPTGDMAFASAKTYDLDVYSAVSGEWLEVSSASNTGGFQARRANIRFRRDAKAKPEFVHLLNASGLALPRIVIALLENNQLEDGTVAVPEPLQKYMRGVERLEPPENPLPFFD
jgi:seryl-tRNA synthetase